ncbi:hypothetical protein [Vibrio breoganii]|uniref:hypothetical protein n=1 Tax=Vibrio breoganii TaxID=553239 RepID=UPI000C827CDF|nr:hypothetical protein [Vibrio breoganii]PMK26630.1 hypothetical protein BCU03_18845 [Vibrio breoganii]PMM90219.1 hypothetical protein BCT44_00115 [Vibrio breoganii]
MKTLKALLLTSLFVAPVAFASSLPINPTFNSQTNYVWEDPSERTGGGGYTWADPSERTGGGGYTWADPSERTGGGGYTWEDSSERRGGGR